MELLGYPNHPYRGDFSRWINFSVLLFSVGFMLILVFWVVDATRLCAQFIAHLSTQELPWNREKLALLSQRYQITEDYLGPVLKIRLVADQTIVISRLIIYPFIILALMIISRLSYFDNWTIPMGLIIVFLLLFLYVLICGITLERAAENARAQTGDWLMEKHIGITGDPAAPNYRSEQLQLLIEDLRNIQRGAYVPFIQQPMVRAILLPFGGVGSIAFIEYLYSILG
ncbi:hypothetical protein [Nitrosococcus oceani]|uniref:hypothetical protein n=1 Tax=Nitrosococcus oceani TaxID=1229 RepID=UPI0004E90069|nr:hypothetical protein [Nitrosococcus oceani]KFI22434.1 hypothetical protein HW44_09455 [Nitrosococcus oceani]